MLWVASHLSQASEFGQERTSANDWFARFL